MNQLYKGNTNYILSGFAAMLLLCITFYSTANSFKGKYFSFFLTSIDTLPPAKNPKLEQFAKDSARLRQLAESNRRQKEQEAANKKSSDSFKVNTIDTFDVKSSKDSLDAPIKYHADDSMILDVPAKKIYLYGKETKVNYTDNELVAPHIEFDQATSTVKAHLTRDSAGNVISFPTFTQGDNKSVSDSIWFNLKSGKGLTKSTYFTQDEMFVHVDKGKKVKERGDDVIYALKSRFTTCNYDTPHFAFLSNRGKFINKKMAITGAVHPEFEGVPVPIYLPFGIFPLQRGRHSGILAPTFSANEQLGLSLEGLGYYKVLSKNWDITTRGTIYSYGGYTASVSPRYYKRYHYQGDFSLDYQHFKYNFKGDPDYSLNKSFNIRWHHSMDSKARPGVSFSASVNAGSSKFNSLVPNSPNRNFQNQLNSSITYSKTWNGNKDKERIYNLTVGAGHDQNTNSKLINVRVPDVSFSMSTVYPFRQKEKVGDYKWYENIGVALNTNAKSYSHFSDDTAITNSKTITNQIVNNFQWGAAHNVPITLSLPPLGAFQVSPSVSFAEKWYQEKFVRTWNPTTKHLDSAITKGFFAAREMSFGVSFGTRIFGMFGFKPKSKISAIRHEMRPTISASYKPDMNRKYFYTTQLDISGFTVRDNVFQRSVFGSFSEGKFGGLSFGIDNNLQMKVKQKNDTGTTYKKVNLLDGFGIAGSYNFLQDTQQLSTFSLNARTNLFEKINISASAQVDPYEADKYGKRTNTLVWKNKWNTLGRLTGGNISMSSSFQGGNKKENNNQQNEQRQQLANMAGMPIDEYEKEQAYISSNPGEFANFNIPWSLNLSYSMQFYRAIKTDNSGYTTKLSQNINWGGTLNLTPKWQIGLNGYYDITGKSLGTISTYLTREMHCWQMAINISPIGTYRFFNISIHPKSGLLRDLKVNRTRYFYDL